MRWFFTLIARLVYTLQSLNAANRYDYVSESWLKDYTRHDRTPEDFR
ncbi:MAG TPA: hypothetical protein VFO16_01600 [Pseudonocardiaceae bacterium]|nr:hypothetical protein [Pseudonocardiaceae bacterium]